MEYRVHGDVRVGFSSVDSLEIIHFSGKIRGTSDPGLITLLRTHRDSTPPQCSTTLVPCCSRVRTVVSITHMTSLTIEKERSDTFLVHTLSLYIADVESSLESKIDRYTSSASVFWSVTCKQLASAVGHQIAGGAKYQNLHV